MLDFERHWAEHQGRKEGAIKARLNLSGARYYELLAALVEDPEAMRYDPLTVRRLQRRRRERLRRRADRAMGDGNRH